MVSSRAVRLHLRLCALAVGCAPFQFFAFTVSSSFRTAMESATALAAKRPHAEVSVPERPTLTYWNGRGLCEQVRFMLAACGVDYAEKVPGLPGVTHLSEKAHMEHLRKNGYLVFNQVPLLCIDGLKLVQSRAIVRYLAAKYDLAGETPGQVAMCDIVAESIHDWLSGCGRAFEFCGGYHPDKNQQDAIYAAHAKYLPLLERLAAASETGYLLGSYGCKGMTYPDVLLLEGIEMALSRDPKVLVGYPNLDALHKKLLEAPRLKEFLASDLRKTKDPKCIPAYKKSVIDTLY